MGDTYYAYSTDGGQSFSENRRVTDRSINLDVGLDRRVATYTWYGPTMAQLGTDAPPVSSRAERGGPATSYGPALRVRRDQMASFLLRAASYATEQELASQTAAFPDVGQGNAHFGNVNGAHEVGLAQGFPDGTYRPAAGVRRDQMSTFIIRLLTHLAEAG